MATTIDIGIAEGQRKELAEALSRLLADTYTLYLTIHGFHWNVTGPQFQQLHDMFMTQYTELWGSVDLIAERIRALGFFAPASYGQLSKLASIETPSEVPDATEMVRRALAGYEAVAKTARGILPPADAANDQVTIDLLTQRLQIHEKTAWMLRSMLQ
jgi:starvation-inducible DNA-binding protein